VVAVTYARRIPANGPPTTRDDFPLTVVLGRAVGTSIEKLANTNGLEILASMLARIRSLHYLVKLADGCFSRVEILSYLKGAFN
jgi:hypothetical protein